jgi:transposase
MQPYSIDFRQKIIEIYQQENISIRKLAQRFKVAKSFIQKLLKQYRETGNLSFQKSGGSPPRKLQSEQLITLIEIIESNNDATKNACVVMDNAKIHLGETIRELIEKAGAKLIYLSPYSPEFSPIENFWSKVKASLRKVKPRNYKDLINAIADSMLKVTKEDIRNWFAHCCYCTS